MSTHETKHTTVEHTAAESGPTGIARCAELATQSAPYTVHGVAIGADEVTFGENGEKFWPADELRQAVQSLVGVPLTKNHDDNTVESVVGEVIDAGFVPDVGIAFEAEVDDVDLATKIARGRLEVSVHAIHTDGGRTDSGALRVEDIRFLDLSVVPRGGSPSNYVEAGSSPSDALASLSVDDVTAYLDDNTDTSMNGDIDENESENTADEQGDKATGDNAGAAGADEQEASVAMDVGSLVMWDGGPGMAYGAIVMSTSEGCFNDKIDGDVEVCARPDENDPAHLIELHEETDDGWAPTGEMVGHLDSALSAWDPDAPVLDEPMSDDGDEGGDAEMSSGAEAGDDAGDGAGEASASAGDETGTGVDADEVAALRAENQELRNELESVRLEYATQLSKGSPFEAAELASKFSFDELQAKFEEAEASLVADTSSAGSEEASAAPRTGSTSSELSTGSGSGSDKAAKLQSKIDSYEEMGWDAAKEDAEERLAEITQ